MQQCSEDYTFSFLKKVPGYVWIIVFALAAAETLFWPFFMQIDHMFWNVCSEEEQAQMWIPEFGWTYRNCFILFFNLVIVGYHILIVVIVWLTARHLYLKQ